MSNYSLSTKLDVPFAKAVELVKDALSEQGFGVLTEIDMQATIKKKLDKDMDAYLILGACHPPSAYEAVKMEEEIGLMLPCNVIVWEKNGEIHVSAIKPSVAMGMISNPDLQELAEKIEEKLQHVIQSL